MTAAIQIDQPSAGTAGRPLRVLHVLPDLALGGGQQLIYRMAVHADPQRFRFHVCYFRPIREMEPLFSAKRVPLLYLPHTGWWRSMANCRKLIAYVRRNEIDLIHVHGTPLDKFYGMTAAAACKLPVIRTLHGMKLPRFRASLPRILVRPARLRRIVNETTEAIVDAVLERRTVRHVIAVSEPVLESWTDHLERRGIGPEQITLNVNAVPQPSPEDTSEETLAGLRRELGVEGAFPILINIGRITTAKGQDLLIPMMARLVQRWPNGRLVLVGDGQFRSQLEAEASRLGVRSAVLFLGQRFDTSRLLALSDAMVFASHFEGVALSVLEAMAARKPVIAVDIPGTRRVVEDGVTGRLVPRAADAMADAVWAVLSDPQKAAAMGEQGGRIARKQYGMDRFMRQLGTAYRSAVPEATTKSGGPGLRSDTQLRPAEGGVLRRMDFRASASASDPGPQFAPLDDGMSPERNGHWLRGAARRVLESRMAGSRQRLTADDFLRSAMVFAPHFDDEVLGCGGTIIRKKAAGAAVHIAFMTDGSRSHSHLMAERQLCELRAREGYAAAQAMGIPADDVTLLNFPETRLGEYLATAAEAVLALLQECQPEEVFIPYRRDGNQDHLATHRAVLLALREYGRVVWLYEYPVWFWHRWPWVADRAKGLRRVPRFYKDALLAVMQSSRELTWAADVSDVLEEKRRALLRHRSQTARLDGDPAWQVLGDVANGEFLLQFFQGYELFARRRFVAGGELRSCDGPVRG